MKLREWCDFNFNNDQFSNNIGDIIVKVFRRESHDNNNKMFQQLLRVKDALDLFGDFKLFSIGADISENGYRHIAVFICKPEEVGGDNK